MVSGIGGREGLRRSFNTRVAFRDEERFAAAEVGPVERAALARELMMRRKEDT